MPKLQGHDQSSDRRMQVFLMLKRYPRARISQTSNRSGWVIDLIQNQNAVPKRVASTYATNVWAYKAACAKIPARPKARTTPPFDLFRRPRAAAGADPGPCGHCNRPMRPTGAKASEFPGTVLCQRDGICQTCNRRLL